MQRYLSLAVVLGTIAAYTGALGQRIYSYVNEDGVRVFSNIGSQRTRPVQETTGTARDNLTPMISDISNLHGIDPELVHAIIRVESDFDPLAVSDKKCMGLMQLHPDTAIRFGVSDIFDPRQNIEGGIRYLTWLMEEFDSNLDHVLAAYNAGENAVRRYNGVPPYPETRNYIRKIRKHFAGEMQISPGLTVKRRASGIRRVLQEDGSVLYTNLGGNENE